MSVTNETVTTFYKDVIESVGLCVVDDIVHQYMDDDAEPVLVENKTKTLILPTERWLNEPDWSSLRAFHPLSESILRKESMIFKFIRKSYLMAITRQTCTLFGEFARICADAKSHDKLNPITQVPMLSCAPKADDKLVDVINKLTLIFAKGIQEGDNKLINLVVLRGKEHNGKKYSRVCKVTFPFLEELKKDEGTVFGVKLRKADTQALLNFHNYVFQELLTDMDYFTSASHGQVAPSFYVLTQSYAKLMQTINKHLQNFLLKTNPLRFIEDLNNFDAMKNVIPTLEGNEGEATENEPASDGPVQTARGSLAEYVPQDRRNENNYRAPAPIGSTSGIKKERHVKAEVRQATKEDLFGGSSSRYDRYERNDRRVDRHTLRGNGRYEDYNTRDENYMLPRGHYIKNMSRRDDRYWR